MLKGLQWLILSNIYIAIAAVSFLFANVLIFGIEKKVNIWLYIHVFFATWFIYQLSRWLYHHSHPVAPVKDVIYEWLDQYPRFTKYSIAISLLIALLSYIFLDNDAKFIIVCIGIISIAYPIKINIRDTIYRLRDFPFLKILLIAIVWAATCVVLPSCYKGMYIRELQLTLIQAIFIVIITLPFDINDIHTDVSNKLKTIPTVFGIKKSIVIQFLLILLYQYLLWDWLSTYSVFSYIFDSSITIFLFIMNIVVLISTYKLSQHISKWMIMLIYDGSLIIYLFLVMLARTIEHNATY